MIPVSALLIVKNEEVFIQRALNSLSWCDEIVVIDAMSTDKTAEICQNPAAPWSSKIKFLQHAWLGFSAQRNFAMNHAKHDWVFFLDGDEECSPDLAAKLKSLLSNPSGPGAFQYKIRRQEFFLKKPIHYSIWNPSYHIRFFNKRGVQFIHEVHEGVKSPWETRSIDEPIIHVENLQIERFLTKLNHYTTLQAKIDYAKGVRTNTFKIIMAFPAMFYKNYIYYRGYKDGYEGFIISVLEGISRTVRHLKLWQLGKLLILLSLFSGCSISKPCAEGGDVSWNPKIVGDKKCSLKTRKDGKKVLDGPFKQEYQSTHTIALEGNFEDGLKSGMWSYYGEDKKLKSVKYFDQGVEKTPPPEVQKKIDMLIIQKNGVLSR